MNSKFCGEIWFMHDPKLMNGFETIAKIRRFSSIFCH